MIALLKKETQMEIEEVRYLGYDGFFFLRIVYITISPCLNNVVFLPLP